MVQLLRRAWCNICFDCVWGATFARIGMQYFIWLWSNLWFDCGAILYLIVMQSLIWSWCNIFVLIVVKSLFISRFEGRFRSLRAFLLSCAGKRPNNLEWAGSFFLLWLTQYYLQITAITLVLTKSRWKRSLLLTAPRHPQKKTKTASTLIMAINYLLQLEMITETEVT